jgi:hypothetical protein
MSINIQMIFLLIAANGAQMLLPFAIKIHEPSISLYAIEGDIGL